MSSNAGSASVQELKQKSMRNALVPEASLLTKYITLYNKQVHIAMGTDRP